MRLVLSFVLVWAIAYAEASERESNLTCQTRSPKNKIDYSCCGQRPLVIGNGVLDVENLSGHPQEAIPYSHPSICSIRWYNEPLNHICTGALVKNLAGQYYIITTYSTVSYGYQYYVAYCAVYNRTDLSEPQVVRVRFNNMTKFDVSHPREECDIAIFKLSTNLPFNLNISAVCLPNEDWFEGEVGLFAGWYNKTETTTNIEKVHQFQTRIRSRARCQEKYGNQYSHNMLCSSLPLSEFHPCGYEFGAPLYTYRDKRWTLTGVGMWVPDCRFGTDRLLLYTDIFQVKDWINGVINKR